MNLSMQDDADPYEHKVAAAQAAGAEVRDYDSSASYSIGELVRKPREGVGVVIGLSTGYVDVWFAREKRTKLKARNK